MPCNSLPYSTTISEKDWWFFRSPTNFNQIYVNGISSANCVSIGRIILNGVDITTQFAVPTAMNTLITTSSGAWNSTYSTVSTLSAEWTSSYTVVAANSAFWSQTTTPPLSVITAMGASTTDTLYLSTVNAASIQVPSITTSGVNVGQHVGITNSRRVVLMDEDGNSFMVNIRGGVLTFD